MTRKHKALIALGLVVAFGLGMLVARQFRRPRLVAPAPSQASSGSASAPCVDFHEAAAHVGENGCVSGRVLRVFTSRAGHTFLDFCADYRDCPFTSVIFAADRSKFGDLQSLEGRQVEIRGFIKVYRSRPEIVISETEQIRAAQ